MLCLAVLELESTSFELVRHVAALLTSVGEVDVVVPIRLTSLVFQRLLQCLLVARPKPLRTFCSCVAAKCVDALLRQQHV